MERADAISRFSKSRAAVLATVGVDGPHLVPVVFAADRDRIYTAVDHKPKRSRRLRRLRNIEHNSMVSLLADEYDDDWGRLWWVRVDGTATVVNVDAAEAGVDLLVAKYPQYGEHRPAGPVIVVSVERWTGWSATG